MCGTWVEVTTSTRCLPPSRCGQHTATFERHGAVALHPVGALDDAVRGGEGALDIAERVVQTGGLVAMEVTEQHGRGRVQRRLAHP